MNLILPRGAERILERLESRGFEAYVVGGCVRDSLLGREPHDWDICTAARPEQVEDCFRGIPVLETGRKHGTVTVMLEREPYEITTFRVEGPYSDSRHPDSVTFVPAVEMDLARRDFTINAMAYSPRRGLVDCFDGRGDLQAKQIRCVGEPDLRFQEDALRILRALRFSSSYGFSIETNTGKSIHKNRILLQRIAQERIQAELKKFLTGIDVEYLLREYSDVLFTVIPELSHLAGFEQKNPHHIFDVWEHTIHAVGASRRDELLRLCLLLHDVGKPACCTEDEQGIRHFYGHAKKSAEIAELVLRRLRFDAATIRSVREIVFFHDSRIEPRKPEVRRWLNKVGEKQFRLLLEVKEADARAQAPIFLEQKLQQLEAVQNIFREVCAENSCFQIRDLRVGGRELLRLGIPSGPLMGKILKILLQQVIDEEIENETEPLLQEAKKIWEDSC